VNEIVAQSDISIAQRTKLVAHRLTFAAHSSENDFCYLEDDACSSLSDLLVVLIS
jgi:hypothetical protein